MHFTPESCMVHLIGSQKIVQDLNSDIDILTIPSCEKFVHYVDMSLNIYNINICVWTLTFMCNSLA